MDAAAESCRQAHDGNGHVMSLFQSRIRPVLLHFKVMKIEPVNYAGIGQIKCQET